MKEAEKKAKSRGKRKKGRCFPEKSQGQKQRDEFSSSSDENDCDMPSLNDDSVENVDLNDMDVSDRPLTS